VLAGDGLAPGDYLRLEVADSGCGMSPEAQARAFEPFFTTKSTGRGLGLAAVKGILRAHEGAVHVGSEVGIGTTITVLLPVAPGAAFAAASPPAAPPRLHGRVLLADDEDTVRRVTARLLTLLGLEVVEAPSGAAAIELFACEPAGFAAAMLDFSMPGLDGLRTYERLLALRPDLPGLLASGYGLEEMDGELARHPRLVVIRKPYGEEDLARALAGLLRATGD
jgi:CheY-like chemotaxis protein